MSLLLPAIAMLSPSWAQDETEAPDQLEMPAEDASEGADDDAPPNEEIIVYGQLEVQRRRAEVVEDLRTLGYREVKREDGKAIYRAETAWHPDVVIYDSGFVILKRSPIRFEPPDLPGLWGSYLVCVAVIPCTKLGGALVSKRKLDAKKSDVAYETDLEIDAWREAVVALHMNDRLNSEIPDLLDDIWKRGMGEGDATHATMADRRKALLDFWATRADTPEGFIAREVTATYIEQIVMSSEEPVTPQEAAAAEAKCGCELPFEVPRP